MENVILRGGPANGKNIQAKEEWNILRIDWVDWTSRVVGSTVIYMPLPARPIYYQRVGNEFIFRESALSKQREYFDKNGYICRS